MFFTIAHVGTKTENDIHILNNDALIMKARVTETPLAGLLVVNIEYFQDERGFFMESWNKRDFAAASIDARECVELNGAPDHDGAVDERTYRATAFFRF